METDILIVGGGLVGAALACAARTLPFRITIVDAAPFPADDQRLIALTYTNQCLLKKWGLWEKLQAFAQPIQRIHVSKKGSFGSTELQAKECDLPALGYVIPAKKINEALYQTIHQCSHINIIRPAQLQQFTIENNIIHATLTAHEKTLKCTSRILIGADGIHSTVRQLLNIPLEEHDYHQSAIVTQTELKRSHHATAYQRFQKKGAIAMLPLDEHRVATIWTTENQTANDLMALTDTEFLKILQAQFGYRLGSFQKIHQRFRYPLRMSRATKTIHGNIMLLGNAANTMHPIAAQGLNLALYEINTLIAHLNKQSIDTLSLDNLPTIPQQKTAIDLSHNIASLFSSDLYGVRCARQFGLIGLDILPFLKRRFIRRALGQTFGTHAS